ncbi:DoxX family protein [Ornithinimicrobium tianjinense]|uniref:Membrane protein n=1 Tax=Ornithinimicrobium tianjinense TaxID=1195761 RepID=A0A917BTQ9_9MICO|nr:DoxX family protein [Ornithinimicrobium tianjinense]GGF58520.1 membrane protein [Ornithinimicrobium tianjinense]
MPASSPRPPAGVTALASAFVVAGVLHLVRPDLFEPIVPRRLPAKRELVLGSGVAEIACGAGLLVPRTRALAGRPSALLLVGVFPANVQMCVSYGQRALRTRRPAHVASFAATVVRLPLQWPMIRTALGVAGVRRASEG